jgi:hypothetical protein
VSYKEKKSYKNPTPLALKKKSKNKTTLIFTLMGNGEHDEGYLIINSMLKNVLLCKSYEL